MSRDSEQRKLFSKENILTVPNAITMSRLLLIPLFTWLYLGKQNHPAALAVIALSGISDILDSKIARRFHKVSDLGKILDPIVDKFTQAAMLFCLLRKFPHMIFTLVILAVKEVVTGAMSLIAINRSSTVQGAEWPGKLTTGLLYAAVLIHILWLNINPAVSDVIIVLCIACMLFAFVYYGKRNLKIIYAQNT